ncbi:MAG TPA: Crp/Fnr family transcriptional regulator [Bacteroidetes bacterium]|nr:Crp/Fnr family transcriptional regulator [Bacteroidota bacterium]
MDQSVFLKKFVRPDSLEFQREFLENGRLQSVPEERIIASEGDKLAHFPLVVDGLVRVYKIGETGREITLYHIGPGEGCILSASCLLSDEPFPALAETVEDSLLILVPRNVFKDWIDRYKAWREYVFRLLARRLGAILTTIEEVAFMRMDARIAAYLMKESQKKGPKLPLTHGDIARELGTAREVVSRILKDFERRGYLHLSRKSIEIVDAQKLRRTMRLAHEPGKYLTA